MKKYYTVILSILNVISSFLLVSLAFITRYFINYVTADHSIDRNKVLLSALFLLIVVVLQILIKVIYYFIRSHYLLYLDYALKKKIHQSVLNKEMVCLSKYHSGEITNIYMNDLRNVEEFLATIIPSFFAASSRFLFSFVALVIIDWKFLLLLVAFGFIASFIGAFYSRVMKNHSKVCLESDGKVTSFMQESFENIKIVKALEVEDNVADELEKRLLDNKIKKGKRNKFSIIGFTGMYGLMNLSYAMCLAYGGYAIAFLGLHFGDLSALLQLVSYLEGPLGDFPSYLNAFANYKASSERINDLLNLDNEECDETINDFDSIVFENITFYYEVGKPVIEDFSLEIKKEDITIFKGESGRGKTTLFMIMLGFLKPIRGRGYIRYRGQEYPFSKATRNLFSYVPQDNIIFSGTIRDNFLILASCSDEEKIFNALKQACVFDDVKKMPLGLDTSLKERGQGLSMGQIQRLLIAISLINNKKVLLLDEFTSSLDMKTESEIVKSLESLKKTIVMISHRKLCLDNYNEVVLD